MKVGIMQPYFFPYIGYWQLIKAVDKFVIYDDVNFIKRGWINRNKILNQGEGKFINLLVSQASQNKLINELEVLKNLIHNKKLLKTLESCYRRAPYYADVLPVIESIITQDEGNLARYLEFLIMRLCEYLSIDTEIILSSRINKNNDLRGQDKIIEICKILGADEYINGTGGQALYSREEFAACGIHLKFLKTDEIVYQQNTAEFVPNLSIIDVMMFNGPGKINEMLDGYELL
ncbi:MAG: WbqC family protein [Pelotomaculum sp.]|jgi:hypothetical protein